LPDVFIRIERNRILDGRDKHPIPNRAEPLLPILQIIDDLLY
jgi:hypothetical protein